LKPVHWPSLYVCAALECSYHVFVFTVLLIAVMVQGNITYCLCQEMTENEQGSWYTMNIFISHIAGDVVGTFVYYSS
jgi:hypothetical protein